MKPCMDRKQFSGDLFYEYSIGFAALSIHAGGHNTAFGGAATVARPPPSAPGICWCSVRYPCVLFARHGETQETEAKGRGST